MPGNSIIVGFSVFIISKPNSAAALSDPFAPGLSLRLPSSFRTSWGISHSIGSDIIWLARVWMSIFCFVVVMMKFVSSNIFMLV